MNRLFILGNGFDLAHGLPTGYKHFIDDYWINGDIRKKSDNLCTLDIDNSIPINNIKSYRDIINLLEDKSMFPRLNKQNDSTFIEHLGNYKSKYVLKFKNVFFETINQNLSIQNWVDIENEYYRQLKSIINSDKSYLQVGEDLLRLKKEKVKVLNQEFTEIKSLFEKYLKEKILMKYVFEHFHEESQDYLKILNLLKPISVYSGEKNILNEFSNSKDKEEIAIKFKREAIKKIENKVYILNFNYTYTAIKYLGLIGNNLDEKDLNHIHGILGNETDNPINFGFGDEMDEDYKLIENINDNEYLRNFKSFQYLQNSNYSNLLSYIDSDKFQVVVMGHSCGLSDRTLLNTIFEHNNCRSIKVYYHQWVDEKTDKKKDNYTEIIQNISRHFNDKKKMREKIVNKTLCQPLPQIQLPKK